MFSLENEYIRINVNENGGSLTSIYDKVNKNELLYQPDERSWHGQDVVIFPFVARLKNGHYKVDGEDYYMKNHGLVRYNKVTLSEKKDNMLILSFDSNDETLKEYPYKFSLKIKYILDGYKLSIRYNITNIDDKPIYYEFGGHPALKVSGYETSDGFEYDNTKVEFDTSLEIDKYYLDDTGSYIIGKGINKIPREVYLKKNIISDSKTLIFDAKNIDNVILTTNGYSFKFDISEAEILAFWCDPKYGDYICIEPWWGIPDIINPNLELKDKPLMHSLNPFESEEKGYTIVISKNV